MRAPPAPVADRRRHRGQSHHVRRGQPGGHTESVAPVKLRRAALLVVIAAVLLGNTAPRAPRRRTAAGPTGPARARRGHSRRWDRPRSCPRTVPSRDGGSPSARASGVAAGPPHRSRSGVRSVLRRRSRAPGSKRVAVVFDFGDPADAPTGQTPPAARGTCVVAPTAATGARILSQAAAIRTDRGLVCAIGGCRPTSAPRDAATPQPKPTPSPAQPRSPSPNESRDRSDGVAAPAAKPDPATPRADPGEVQRDDSPAPSERNQGSGDSAPRRAIRRSRPRAQQGRTSRSTWFRVGSRGSGSNSRRSRCCGGTHLHRGRRHRDGRCHRPPVVAGGSHRSGVAGPRRLRLATTPLVR